MKIEPKILVWDIECTNLNADWGYILSIAWKWYGDSKVYHTRIDKTKAYKKPGGKIDDSEVVLSLQEAMCEADAQVTWYGAKFDYPYVQSRLLFHRLPIMPAVPMIDGWRIAKYKMKLSSNRLQNLENFLGFEGYKTPVGGKNWKLAATGDKKAMDYVVDHNIKDVWLTEHVYTLLRPLAPSICNHNMYTSEFEMLCPSCGSDKVQKRGTYRTAIAEWHRYHCQECGHWSKKPNKDFYKLRDYASTEVIR